MHDVDLEVQIYFVGKNECMYFDQILVNQGKISISCHIPWLDLGMEIWSGDELGICATPGGSIIYYNILLKNKLSFLLIWYDFRKLVEQGKCHKSKTSLQGVKILLALKFNVSVLTNYTNLH